MVYVTYGMAIAFVWSTFLYIIQLLSTAFNDDLQGTDVKQRRTLCVFYTNLITLSLFLFFLMVGLTMDSVSVYGVDNRVIVELRIWKTERGGEENNEERQSGQPVS